MRAHHALWGLIAVIGIAAPAMAIPAEGSPCGAAKCPEGADSTRDRLNEAWWSDITTDDDRAKMREIISANTAAGSTNWSAVGPAYFTWRATAHGYNYDPTGKAHNYSAPPTPDWGAMREAGEQAIRARLIDPSSAEFEWPFGFANGTWKPFLQRRIPGWFTCGSVNAKNRMGGYVGRQTFVVVIDGGSVVFTDMDDGTNKLNLVDAACSKSVSMLPRPQSGMLDTPRVASPTGAVDVADEIAKLAALRDKGILTPAEFEAQKAKLLNQ